MMPLRKQEIESDLAFIEQEIAREGVVQSTTRYMWEQRRDALSDELRSLQSTPLNHAQVAVLFNGQPVIGSQEIRADFAGRFLEDYQSVVTAVAASRAGRELRARGRLPQALTSKLYLRDMIRGSVGFLIEEEEPRQLSLVPTLLKGAVEETQFILSNISSSSVEDSQYEIESLSPRITKNIKKLVKSLYDAGAETRIVGGERELDLSLERVSYVLSRLSEIEIAERLEDRGGRLLGLFPERKQYEFQPIDGAPLIYGPVSDEFDILFKSNPDFARSALFRNLSANFLITSAVRGGSVQSEEWTLLGIASTDGQLDDLRINPPDEVF